MNVNKAEIYSKIFGAAIQFLSKVEMLNFIDGKFPQDQFLEAVGRGILKQSNNIPDRGFQKRV